jgi:hypothetical protein
MQLPRLALAALWFSVIAVPCFVAADDDADELKKLAGRYERSFANNAGTMFRVTKEIDGDQERVTTLDDDGNVIASHTATIKVEKRGPVRVFSYSNRVALAGPHKGERQVGTFSYIYRADQDSFVEARGVMDGDPSPPGMAIWKRINDAKQRQ